MSYDMSMYAYFKERTSHLPRTNRTLSFYGKELTLTGAGATYPYGRDDADRNLRIAPTFTNADDLPAAIEILIASVKLACTAKLAEEKK